jgi:hypothetical protein
MREKLLVREGDRRDKKKLDFFFKNRNRKPESVVKITKPQDCSRGYCFSTYCESECNSDPLAK